MLELREQFHDEITNLSGSLERVLQHHELEYMQAYNIFVKRKETEMKQLIDDITQRLGDKVANDKKMKRLELNEHVMKGKAVEWGQEIAALKKQIKNLESRIEAEKNEKQFFHNIAVEHKKQKKLLKISLARLNEDYGRVKAENEELKKKIEFNQTLSQ